MVIIYGFLGKSTLEICLKTLKIDRQSKADDTLAAIAAMIAARNSCMHSWRQGVPDTLALAAMTTAVSGSDYTLSVVCKMNEI